MTIVLDYETIFALVVSAVAILREVQKRKTDAKMRAVVDTVSDELAYVYKQANAGSLCTAETAAQVAKATGLIWTELGTIGSEVASILATKSSLAETLEPSKK